MDTPETREGHFSRWFADFVNASRAAGHGKGVSPEEMVDLWEMLKNDMRRFEGEDWAADWATAAVRVTLGC